MTQRTATRFAAVIFTLYLLGVHWPGILPFAGPRPFILGMPFNLMWVVLWVVLGGVALLALELTRRDEER
jgi:hypothetical protein